MSSHHAPRSGTCFLKRGPSSFAPSHYPTQQRFPQVRSAKEVRTVSPEGQRQSLAELIWTVRATPEGRGLGVLYWYPEAVPVPGLHIWHGGATALFDAEGKALPAIEAFRLRW